jgi:hypothetical protein
MTANRILLMVIPLPESIRMFLKAVTAGIGGISAF